MFEITVLPLISSKITVIPSLHFCINTVTIVFSMRNCILTSPLGTENLVQTIGKYRIPPYFLYHFLSFTSFPLVKQRGFYVLVDYQSQFHLILSF